MSIGLCHTIIPALNKQRTAEFYTQILGLHRSTAIHHDESVSRLLALKLDGELTLFIDDDDHFDSHHYAFRVSQERFMEIHQRLKIAAVNFGSAPFNRSNQQCYLAENARGFYFDDPNGHVLEVIAGL